MSQQLVKKGANGRYDNVMPKSWIEAIKDKYTGQSLLEILQGFNMYFLSYTRDDESTRLLVPRNLRRRGLWITYVRYDKTVCVERYDHDSIEDKYWKASNNWIDCISNNNNNNNNCCCDRVFDGGRADTKYGGAREINCGNALN